MYEEWTWDPLGTNPTIQHPKAGQTYGAVWGCGSGNNGVSPAVGAEGSPAYTCMNHDGGSSGVVTTPGDVLTFSGYFWPYNNDVRIDVIWHNAAGSTLRIDRVAYNSNWPVAWTRWESTVTAPATADWFHLLATTGPGPGGVPSTNYMDNVRITRALPGVANEQLLGTGNDLYGVDLARFEAEPVNTAIGNYVSHVADLTLPGRGLGFAFSRTYNSLDTGVGVLGPGWTHSYAVHLQANPDSSVRFFAEDGQQLLFTPNGSGGYVRPGATYTSLTTAQGGGWDLLRHDQVTYHFDASGALLSETDRNGNALTFAYTAGKLSTITDTVGRTISLGYDGSGRLSTLDAPPSRHVGYGYDANGRLNSVTDVRNGVTSYTYEPGGGLATIVDPKQHTVVTNEYGPDGRVSAQTDARNYRSTFAWDAPTQTSTFTDARNHQWVDVYNANVLQSTRDPLGNTTSYTYDANFNRATITDPRNKITTLTWDGNGNLLTRTAPAPLTYQEIWTYNARNDVATYRDGRLHTTTYEYDPAGNLTKITAPLNSITLFGRDPAGTGLLFSVTDPRNKVTSYGYDSTANRNRVTTPLGNVTTMTYDPAGRMLTQVDPRGNVQGGNPSLYTSTFTYDTADHVLSISDQLNNPTIQTWDPAGNLETVTDANNHTTTYGYDAANHLTSVMDAATKSTLYGYDEVGDLTSRTDANNHVTNYTYDNANRLSTTTDPGTHAWTLTYDPAGNVATRRDANNNTTTYGYDEINRLTSVTYANGSTAPVTYGYDPNSNLTSMVDGATETYAFDDLDRPTGVTRGADTFNYGYDLAGNVTSRTYPGQTAQTITYDNDGRLATANGATHGYDPAGNPLTAATTDGITARFTWDRAGRLLEVANTTSSATLSRFTYALDAAGNRTAMTTRQGTVTYRYDVLNRLTEACWSPSSCPAGPPATPLACIACIGGLLSRPSPSTNPPAGETYRDYTYDFVGNRMTEVSNAGTTSYGYDSIDRLTTTTAPGNVVTNFTFDPNGNETAAGSKTYTYDLADRLKTAAIGSTTETYTYAGDGTRLSASTGSQANKTTKFLWDRNFGLPQLAIERNGSGSLLRSYRYGRDQLSQTAGSTTYWYHHDGLGSTSDVTSNSGASLTWDEYYPYGQVRQAGQVSGNGAPAVQPFLFTGQQVDATTGFYHLRARQYDPATGRFLTTDPIAAVVTDPYVASYVYARNRPTLLIDPSGLASEKPFSYCNYTSANPAWCGWSPPPGRSTTGGGLTLPPPPCNLNKKVAGGALILLGGADALAILEGAFLEAAPWPVKVFAASIGLLVTYEGGRLATDPTC